MKRQRQFNFRGFDHLPEAAYGASNLGPTESRSVTNILTGSHELTVVGYSLAKGMGVGKHIASEIFTVAGYRWAIYLYPDGKNPEDNCLYVSVFVALVSEGTDVRALFKLSLIDQSGKGKHKVQSHFDRPLESGPYTLKYCGSMWGYKRFFRRSLLDTSDFVKDDTLKICCTVGVVVSVTESPNSHCVAIPEANLGQQFGELLENADTADVVFNVAGENFHAHRLVLAARSPVFKSKFFGSSHEQNIDEICIEEMQPKVFKAMLHFIYSDTLPDFEEHTMSLPLTGSASCPSTSCSMLECLLAAADRFMLDRLRGLCEAKIFQSITINNVGRILLLAQRYGASQLKLECLKFAASNLEEVMQSEGFKYLKKNCPSLQSELLETVARFEDDSGIIENVHSTWGHDSDAFETNCRE